MRFFTLAGCVLALSVTSGARAQNADDGFARAPRWNRAPRGVQQPTARDAPAPAARPAAEPETPKPAAAEKREPREGGAPRARLTGIILDTGQVLIWDELASKYVLREVGEQFHGQQIVALEKDRVVLDSGSLELAPAPITARRVPRKLPAVIITGAGESELEPGATTPAPPTPPRAPSPTAEATLPEDAAPEPPGAAPTTPPPRSEPAAPAPARRRDVTPPPAPADPETMSREIDRRELEAALRDFSELEQQVELAPARGGGWRLVRLADDSVVRKLGLREGDVVRRIADLPIRDLDDAAVVYARVRTSNRVSVELEREGQPITLVVKIVG